MRDTPARLAAVLGEPDPQGNGELRYGYDTFEFTPPDAADVPESEYVLVIVDIADPAAETDEGVGIGDNLSLARSRLAARCAYTDFQPYCYRDFDAAGETTIWLFGDPITQIELD